MFLTSARRCAVREKLQQLLANPAFVAETFDDSTPPGKRVLVHDPDTDVYVLAHLHERSEKVWVVRVTGTDLDVLPRYRFNRNTDRMLEAPIGNR